jgi:leader peptidase (prepilin peptidase)/N-methyltransferase
MEHIMSGAMGLWLFLCSIQDIKSKKIHIYLIGLGFVACLSISFVFHDAVFWERAVGAIPGLFMLALNPITRGQIGIGDGLIVLILGVCLGFGLTASILLLGLFASAFFSAILLIVKKAGRKKTIPFIPFLFLGFLGVLITG